jgi:hypothetical protein
VTDVAIEVWVPHGERYLANSTSGVVLDLEAAEWEELASLRRATIVARSVLEASATYLDDEVARRLDLANERHRLVGDMELRVNAPQETVWDVERLRETLDQLVNEGRLAKGVPPRAVRTDVSYKAVARELNKLLAHDDPRVRELIAECRVVVAAKRRVTVREASHVNRP